jgi:UDP-2,3-diacylglucosamine pyrophosphatase LpxH
MQHFPETRRYRTLFLSDIHLGSRGCRADSLLDFLRFHDAETIYLVGDIVDGWRLKRSWHWPQAHNDVVQKLLRKARKGTRIVYIPGNHDEFLRGYPGQHFGGVEVARDALHVTAAGERLLVTHGDQYDAILRHIPWLSRLGDGALSVVMAANSVVNRLRRQLGLNYWSLSAWTKAKVKDAVKVISSYEKALVAEARLAGADGVVCGHIHLAAMHRDFGIRYINTGDWVESCTAVVEHFDGRLELLHWKSVPLPGGIASNELLSAAGD